MSHVDIPATRIQFGPEERQAVLRVLDSGHVVQGPEVQAFESEFAALVSGRVCSAVNSGTSALHLGLLAAGIGPGDQVIAPSFSFAATANAVRLTGAEVVFADIDPRSFCLDPDSVRARATDRTAAIMPVHLYGHMADMTRLKEVADEIGAILIEDAAQAHGATLDGRPAGAWGAVAAFSFYATKNLSTGEGGMVVCEDAGTARVVRLLRNQGMERQYANEVVGLNNRMTDIAAALGRVQIPRLRPNNDRRREIARRYDEGLEGVTIPPVADGVEHVYHQYTIRTHARDRVRTTLEAQGIGVRVFYPVPIHRLPAFDTADELAVTDLAAAEVLSLPIRPTLTDQEVDIVIDAVNVATRETP